MVKKQLNLIYALKDNKTIHISEVESGFKCGCVCPACGEPLIAKKGSKVIHHFAHYAGHNCEHGYESSLHIAAKEIINNAKKFVIPEVHLCFPRSNKEKQLLFPAKEISVDDVKLEQRYGDVIPDIVVTSGGRELFIEIFVTHKIDETKLEKLKRANISTIEIDLSKQNEMITAEELSQVLLENNPQKVWKYNAIAEKYLQQFYSVSDKRQLISRGYAMHVDGCPIKSRVWKGKPYANFIDDCLYCEYCISTEEDGGMLCSGRLRISTLKDFGIPEEKRIKVSDEQIHKRKGNSIKKRKCPNCGFDLVQRQSRYGCFWGCSNYPHCRFMAVVDSETGELKMKS